MSKNWVEDIESMQDKFGTLDWVFDNKKNTEKLKTFLKFRIDFLQEELDETKTAYETMDGEEIVDGLIDICVWLLVRLMLTVSILTKLGTKYSKQI